MKVHGMNLDLQNLQWLNHHIQQSSCKTIIQAEWGIPISLKITSLQIGTYLPYKEPRTHKELDSPHGCRTLEHTKIKYCGS